MSPPLVLERVHGLLLRDILELRALLRLSNELLREALGRNQDMAGVVFELRQRSRPGSRTRRAAPARWASCPSDNALRIGLLQHVEARQLEQVAQCRRSCPGRPWRPAGSPRARIRLSSALRCCSGVRSRGLLAGDALDVEVEESWVMGVPLTVATAGEVSAAAVGRRGLGLTGGEARPALGQDEDAQ